MDILSTLSFIPGNEAGRLEPLARYLPPVPEGVAAAFLAEHAQPAAWVLDPFGASPRLAVEMAHAGYRVLVAVNNPVARFLLDLAAAPPPRSELQAALSELAVSHKGEERLETHLQSLYLTDCTKCQRSVPAEAFIWEREGNAPIARIIHCPQCGESGERDVTLADRERASQLAATTALHRSRALERVAARDDPDREHAEEALACYLPPAVYALITIINRLDGLAFSPERRRCLLALALTACDEGNTLWPHPAERPRPKQLTIPPRFRENNLWLALERRYTLIRPASPHRLLLWQEKGKTIYAFYLLASTVIGKFLRESLFPPKRSLLVIPGGRAGLLTYKLRRDPQLDKIWHNGWRVLKFRHLRRLAESPGLTREIWARELSSDPIEPPEQMKIF